MLSSLLLSVALSSNPGIPVDAPTFSTNHNVSVEKMGGRKNIGKQPTGGTIRLSDQQLTVEKMGGRKNIGKQPTGGTIRLSAQQSAEKTNRL
jgi:hypothetical protein